MGGRSVPQFRGCAHSLLFDRDPRLCLAQWKGHDGPYLRGDLRLFAHGYAWTFSYALVEELQPSAFVALSPVPPNDYVASVLQLRYFSFMTLTTVGYGDIVPRSPAARTLAGLEAVTGQIYLTVLVARLVGLHIAHAQTSSSRED